MKKTVIVIALAAEAALCLLLAFGQSVLPSAFSAVAAFPFEQLGMGLRALSSLGRFGTAAAMALYAAVSLLPVWLLAEAKSRRKLRAEDALLGLLSAALFFGLYLMVNPASIGIELAEIGKAAVGVCLWSIVIAYLLLRFLRNSVESGAEKLGTYLKALLIALAAVFVFSAAYGCFSAALTEINALIAGNSERSELTPSIIFIALGSIVDALPSALGAVTALLSFELLGVMKAKPEESADEAKKLSRRCAGFLAACVLAEIAFNVLQLLFAAQLRNIDVTLTIPAAQLCFVLAVLLFSRVIEENRKLKRDNELFI